MKIDKALEYAKAHDITKNQALVILAQKAKKGKPEKAKQDKHSDSKDSLTTKT